MNPRRDINELTFAVVQQATGEVAPPVKTKAQEAGRQGGLAGGKARSAKLTPDQRTMIAALGAAARWKNR